MNPTPPDPIRQRKSKLRERLRSLRRNIDPATAATAGECAAQILFGMDLWHDARNIAVYLANDGELPTAAIIQQARMDDRRLYLPAINDGALTFRFWGPDAALVENRFRILEPPDTAGTASELDLLIMPVVGWAGDGCRLGMGGGFYDRFLATHRVKDGARNGRAAHRCFRLGLAYEAQRDESIGAARDEWDEPLDGVLTESRFHDTLRAYN